MASEIRQILGPAKDRLRKALNEADELSKLQEGYLEAAIMTFRKLEDKIVRYNDTYQGKYREWLSEAKGDADEIKRITVDSQSHQELTFGVDDALIMISSTIKAVELAVQKREREAHQQKELEIKERLWTVQTQAQAEAAVAAPSTVKLPDLPAVKFDGNVRNWQSFWDSFKASIDDNPKLPLVEKMTYLKSQVMGPAAATIGGLSITAANYPIALKLLTDQFGDKEVIISAHYSALSDLAPAPSQRELRAVFDQIEIHMHSLTSLGEDVNHRQFLTTIKSKLPANVLIQLQHERRNNVWDANTLRQQIRNHLHICESAYQSRQPQGFKPKYAPPSGVSTLMALPNSPSCAFCRTTGGHWSSDCTVYPTADTRKERIQGHCWNCLSASHPSQNCQRSKGCFNCKTRGDHHSSLCPHKYGTPSNGLLATSVEPAVVIRSTSAITTTDGHVNRLISSGETVYLQTATAMIRSPEGRPLKTRLLLDCGSHRSYISEKLAKELRLQPRAVETLSVGTFMSASTRTVQSPVVDLVIQLADKTHLPITVNVIPVITGGVQRAPVKFEHLRPLFRTFEMADTMPQSHEVAEVDLLIGNDYYGDIMTSERVSLMEGLYLLGSKLGWVLSGRMLPDSMVKNQRNTSMPRAPTMVNCAPISVITGVHAQADPCPKGATQVSIGLDTSFEQRRTSSQEIPRSETIPPNPGIHHQRRQMKKSKIPKGYWRSYPRYPSPVRIPFADLQ